ncbi:MAG: TlpA disulfide reductase family protein [Planctomycetota bacterium]
MLRPARTSSRRSVRTWAGAAVLAALPLSAAPQTAAAQNTPPASTILSTYQPKVAGGTGVEIETPPEDQWEQCKVEQLDNGESGYLVSGPQQQTLRKIVDADGDNTIELFIYYNQGMEVYREWDADGAEKNASGVPVVSSNNFRWVNFGGTKWGVDENGDRKIDRWKRISATEAAQVATEALVDGDAQKLATVLVTEDELKALGVAEENRSAVMEGLAGAAGKLRSMREESKLLKSKPTVQSVNAGQPGLILAGQTGTKELEVVENTNALLNIPGGTNMGIVTISELVRVGQPADADVWKLTVLPTPVEGNGQIVLGGPLIQPEATPGNGSGGMEIDPAVARLLQQLAELNQTRPKPDAAKKDQLAFAAKQLTLHRELFKEDKSTDRPFWLTTQADTFHALFLGEYIEAGFAKTELGKIRKLADREAKGALPTVDQRILFVQWGERRKPLGADPKPADLDKFESWWAKSREDFIKQYPKAGESGQFRIELGLEAEQRGEQEKAKSYFRPVVQTFSQSETPQLRQLAAKAAGAMRRLDLVGKPIDFNVSTRPDGQISDADTRGKVTLLTFWNVDCEPCRQNLPILKDLYDKYGDDLQIVAVNVDLNADVIAGYVKENKVPFPIAWEPGGFNGRTATYFGVLNLPTMILADKQGRVVSVDPDIRDVQTKVPQLAK